MENSNLVILDISSDDEASFGDARRGSGCGVGEDHDLLSELLEQVDRGLDDSDDVVLVDEVVVKPKKARLNSLNSSKKTVNYNCGDDDDCVILDCDPDKPLAVKNSEADDEDSDDLLVVGEKGQVACRDYPHPRHLCVTFPFASTSHDTHCDRCHCYVCDSRAPCVHWGSGISSTDHCHATDKEEFWKTERKSIKECDKTKPILNVVPLGNLVPPLHPVQANSSAHNQDFNRVKVRPRTSFGIPNIVRSQPSRPAVLRYRCQPRMVPQPLRSTQDRNIFSKNSRHVGGRGSQIIPPCTSIEGRGLARVDSVNDRRGHGLPKNSYGSQFPSTPPPPSWYASHGEAHPGVSDYANYAPSELQMSSRACRQNSLKTVTSQPQIASQPFNHFQNTTIPQRPLVSQPNQYSTFHPLPSQSHVSTPLYRESSSEYSVSQMSSRPNMESTYECSLSPQPQVYTAPTSSTDGQNIFQQENQMQSGLGSSCVDFGFSWDPSACGSNQQIPAGSSQLQNPVPADNFPYQSIAKEGNSQFQSVLPEDNSYGQLAVPAAENFSLVDDNNSNSEFPGSTDPNLLGFQLDWMFEDQYVPGALEVSVPPGLNIYSPEPGTIDAGTLFDF